MSGTARASIDAYVARLRAELLALGVDDADDHADEIRSMLTEASGDDPTAADEQIARLGDPAALARSIAGESEGPSGGLTTAVWWRIGIAAPLDIVIGVSVPAAAVLPVLQFASKVEPHLAGLAVAALLAAVALAWPFFVWRPWRRGGLALSPGMALAGLVVTREGGTWKPQRIEDLPAGSSVPQRPILQSILIVLLAVLLLGWGASSAFTGTPWLFVR